MNIKSPENLSNNILSIEQASKMFDVLFEDPKNINVVADLFKGIPWLAREQKIQETIKIAKCWLKDLRDNHDNTTA